MCAEVRKYLCNRIILVLEYRASRQKPNRILPKSNASTQ